MIPYPWKSNIAELPDNKAEAKKCLESTERRLVKNAEEAVAYNHKIIETRNELCEKVNGEGN